MAIARIDESRRQSFRKVALIVYLTNKLIIADLLGSVKGVLVVNRRSMGSETQRCGRCGEWVCEGV
jgi:hypothetical protein